MKRIAILFSVLCLAWYLSTGNWTVNGMSFNYNRNTLLGYSID